METQGTDAPPVPPVVAAPRDAGTVAEFVVRRGLPSLLAVAPASLLLAAARLTAWRSDEDEFGRTVITYSVGSTTMTLAMLGAALASVALIVWSLLPRLRVRPHVLPVAIGALGALVLAPLTGLASSGFLLGQYVRGSVTTGGVTWHWGLVGMNDLEATIGREFERSGPRGRMVVVAERAVDEPSAVVVRPSGRSVGEFVVGADGRLYVLEASRCLLAFDPRATPEIPPRAPMPGRARPSGIAPADISPFALLGPADVGDERDVELVLDCIRREREASSAAVESGTAGFPSERVLLDALTSPNAWVRDTARRLAQAGGEELYPAASRRK